jgi:hypothetical protein
LRKALSIKKRCRIPLFPLARQLYAIAVMRASPVQSKVKMGAPTTRTRIDQNPSTRLGLSDKFQERRISEMRKNQEMMNILNFVSVELIRDVCDLN